ncbi:hypothetical protein ScPMuIL_017220 [Solemya velum]
MNFRNRSVSKTTVGEVLVTTHSIYKQEWIRTFLFTSNGFEINIYGNLEKLYAVEDDLILISDVILREERYNKESDGIQDLYNITGFIDEVKEIHKHVGVRMERYLSHPINVYHLLKRLVQRWEEIIPQLLVSELCRRGFRKKLNSITKILPTEDDISRVAEAIVKIQHYHGIPSSTLREGFIGERQSLEPLSLRDWFDLARAAHDCGEYYYASRWLSDITNECQKAKTNTYQTMQFNATNTLSLLATTYYKMGRLPAAVQTLDKLLEMDPSNSNAKRNRQFFSDKRSFLKEIGGEVSRLPPAGQKSRLYENLCQGQTLKTPEELYRLKCFYFNERNSLPYFPQSSIKAEVVNRKPLIVVFHGFSRNATTAAIQSLAYHQISEALGGYSLWVPRGMIVKDITYRRWVSKEQERIHNLELSSFPTALGMKYQAFVFGMEGLTTQHQILPPSWKNMAGTFMTFLSGLPKSGEIVFPKQKTSVPVKRGDSIFFEPTAEMRVCPVIQGSLYVGIQEILEIVPSGISKRKCSLYHSLIKHNL